MSFNRRQNAVRDAVLFSLGSRSLLLLPNVAALCLQFSISDMQNPTASTAKDKANIFSGIAHYHPPGGKSSIDFANGIGSSIQQHNPWQVRAG
jgi:hypothetical protein